MTKTMTRLFARTARPGRTMTAGALAVLRQSGRAALVLLLLLMTTAAATFQTI